MKQVIMTLLVLSALILNSAGLYAEDKATEKAKSKDAEIDLAVPESPAFTALGLNPNNVERPSSPREFATSLLNGTDANGNIKTGLAIDTAPFMLFEGSDMTLVQYQESYWDRFFSRTMLSLATAKGTSDADNSAMFAVGLRLTPWDEGDPRMDKQLMECLTKAVNVKLSQEEEIGRLTDDRDKLDKALALETDLTKKAELAASRAMLQAKIDTLTAEGTAELNKKAEASIRSCRTNPTFKSNLWNKSSWAISIAPTYTSTTGLREDLKSSGVGVWTSLALQLGGSGQFILHYRYRNKEDVPQAGGFTKQDSQRAGGRLRVGSANTNINLEALAVEEENTLTSKKDRKVQYSLGAENKIADNLWLVLDFGSESGNDKGDNIFVRGNLKWAFSSEPTIKTK